MTENSEKTVDKSALSRSEQRKQNRREHRRAPGKAEHSTLEVRGRISRIKTFFAESKLELTRVVWPTRKETIDSTWRLLVLVILAGIYLGLVDSLWSRLLSLVIS
jgi:preprotein translocase subunit SecE